jgi:hypothetical protein
MRWPLSTDRGARGAHKSNRCACGGQAGIHSNKGCECNKITTQSSKKEGARRSNKCTWSQADEGKQRYKVRQLQYSSAIPVANKRSSVQTALPASCSTAAPPAYCDRQQLPYSRCPAAGCRHCASLALQQLHNSRSTTPSCSACVLQGCNCSTPPAI